MLNNYFKQLIIEKLINESREEVTPTLDAPKPSEDVNTQPVPDLNQSNDTFPFDEFNDIPNYYTERGDAIYILWGPPIKILFMEETPTGFRYHYATQINSHSFEHTEYGWDWEIVSWFNHPNGSQTHEGSGLARSFKELWNNFPYNGFRWDKPNQSPHGDGPHWLHGGFDPLDPAGLAPYYPSKGYDENLPWIQGYRP